MRLALAFLAVLAACATDDATEPAADEASLTTLPTYTCSGPAPTRCVSRQSSAVTFALADAHLVDCAGGVCTISSPGRLPATTQRELDQAGALSFTCGTPCGGAELGILLPALGKPKRSQ